MLREAMCEVGKVLQQSLGLVEKRLLEKYPESKHDSSLVGQKLAVIVRSKFRLFLKQFEAKLECLSEEAVSEVYSEMGGREKSRVRQTRSGDGSRVVLRHQHGEGRAQDRKGAKGLQFINFQQFLAYIHKVNEVKELELKFSSFGITDNGSPHLANSLLKYTGLVNFKMDLSHNSIGEEGIRRIAQSITKLEALQSITVNLMYNRIKEAGTTFLLRNVCTLKALQSLDIDLSSNFIGPKGLDEIGRCCRKLKHLKVLRLVLYENYLNDESLRQFIKHLEVMWQLQAVELDLRVNQISKGVMAEIMSLAKNHKIDKFVVHK